MKSILVFFLALSVLGNIVGIFVVYKAFKYREAVSAFQEYNKKLLEKYQALQTDYAGISVYAAENKRVLEEIPAAERKNMTVLFGASITRGLEKEKFLPGRRLINRGVGSQSHMQLFARFSNDVLQLEPGQVVFKLCATNLIPGQDTTTIWNEYAAMAMMADYHGIKPLLATVIPVTRDAEQYDNYSLTETVKNFNARIMDFAAEHDFRVVDYFEAMADRDGFLPDSLARDEIHPNDAGYEVMARVLSPFLE